MEHGVHLFLAMVRLTLTMSAPSGESWRLVDALRSLMVPARAEHGCVGCEVALSTESHDPSCIRYVENWSTEEDLRDRVRSDGFLSLIAVMEKALDPPRIQFELAGGTRGLDYVAEVRRHC